MDTVSRARFGIACGKKTDPASQNLPSSPPPTCRREPKSWHGEPPESATVGKTWFCSLSLSFSIPLWLPPSLTYRSLSLPFPLSLPSPLLAHTVQLHRRPPLPAVRRPDQIPRPGTSKEYLTQNQDHANTRPHTSVLIALGACSLGAPPWQKTARQQWCQTQLVRSSFLFVPN